jgi:YD repeat-containing protein
LGASVDPDGVTNLYEYDAKGEQAFTAIHLGSAAGIDFVNDRVTFTGNVVTTDHGTTSVRQTQVYVWSTTSPSTTNLVSMVETSCDGLESWQTRYGPTSSVTSQSVTVYHSSSGLVYRTNTVTAKNGSYVVTVYLNGVRQSVALCDSNGTNIGGTTFTYDPHGRLATATDARNGTTIYAYNKADQVVSTTTPSPGSGMAGLTTQTFYNKML